ncbi:MAG TPA: hypothetical protein VH835_15340 [Dongiaceae bacterium]|jgi:hypothetical protein
MLRAKLVVLALAFGLIALSPTESQAAVGDAAAITAERGTRATVQPTSVVSWDLSGLFTLLRSGR